MFNQTTKISLSLALLCKEGSRSRDLVSIALYKDRFSPRGRERGGLSISTYELIDRDQEMAVEKKILLELFELKLRRCSEFSIVAIFR